MGAAKNTRTGRDFLLRSLADGAARFNTGDCDAFYPGADILGGGESTGQVRGARGGRRGAGPRAGGQGGASSLFALGGAKNLLTGLYSSFIYVMYIRYVAQK